MEEEEAVLIEDRAKNSMQPVQDAVKHARFHSSLKTQAGLYIAGIAGKKSAKKDLRDTKSRF